MESILAEINALEGVLGSFICDNRGEVILNAVPADLNIAALRGISRQVMQALAARKSTQEGIREMDLAYERIRVLARDLIQAALVVLCRPDVNIALVRLTLNVKVSVPEISKRMSKLLPKGGVDRIVDQENLDEISWRLYTSINEGGL